MKAVFDVLNFHLVLHLPIGPFNVVHCPISLLSIFPDSCPYGHIRRVPVYTSPGVTVSISPRLGAAIPTCTRYHTSRHGVSMAGTTALIWQCLVN